MSYEIFLKGKGKFNLSFKENGIVLESGGNKIPINFDEIQKVHLTPVRRTSKYYYPPTCVINTEKNKFKITSREYSHHVVSSMFESKSEDVKLMSKIVHELHRILVDKNLNNRIKFSIGGSFFLATLFLYPIFIAGPVIQGFEGSPVAIFILLAVYVILIFIVKKRKYDPIKFAENINSVSRELN